MIPRYALPEMAAVWDERTKLRHWLRIELAAAEAWTKLGVIPEADMAEIRDRAGEVDPARVAELEATLQHDVVAFLEALAERVGPASRWIHYGMTSSDLLDTALALQLRDACDVLLARADRLVAALKRRALELRDVVCVGRTHGVHAEPTTFGLKLAVFAFQAARDRARLARARETVAVGKVAGPVGTYASVDPRVEEHVCAELGLRPAEAVTQVVQRDRHAEYLAACALAATTCEAIATEVRHLQRTEVREAEEPFGEGQKGSSAMPHKRNPVACERICGLARVVRSALVAGLESVALWHERDISHSSVERVVLPDASIALDYILDLTRWVVEGMRVFPERMRANLEASGGLVYSQAVLLALVEAGLSREDAYAVVQRAAMATWEEGGSFRDRLLADETVRSRLGEARLDEIMDPARYLVHVDRIFERLERL
jgi:adenylosuccinate lyase